MKRFLLYLIRWQCSTPILAICLNLLGFSVLVNTIIANLIGGIVFYFIDKRIFEKKEVEELAYKMHEAELVHRTERNLESLNYEQYKTICRLKARIKELEKNI